MRAQSRRLPCLPVHTRNSGARQKPRQSCRSSSSSIARQCMRKESRTPILGWNNTDPAMGCPPMYGHLNKQAGFHRSGPNALAIAVMLAVIASEPGLAQLPQFKDVARDVGITASHISTLDKQYILESMSGGVGLIDCGNTGRLDIIVANGSTVERFPQGRAPMITLYHQEEGFKFTDIN